MMVHYALRIYTHEPQNRTPEYEMRDAVLSAKRRSWEAMHLTSAVSAKGPFAN